MSLEALLDLFIFLFDRSSGDQGLHEDVASNPKRSHKIESSLATWPKVWVLAGKRKGYVWLSPATDVWIYQ